MGVREGTHLARQEEYAMICHQCEMVFCQKGPVRCRYVCRIPDHVLAKVCHENRFQTRDLAWNYRIGKYLAQALPCHCSQPSYLFVDCSVLSQKVQGSQSCSHCERVCRERSPSYCTACFLVLS